MYKEANRIKWKSTSCLHVHCSSDKPPNSRWISNAYTTTMSYVLAQKIIKHKEIRKVIYLYCISVSDRSMEGS